MESAWSERRKSFFMQFYIMVRVKVLYLSDNAQRASCCLMEYKVIHGNIPHGIHNTRFRVQGNLRIKTNIPRSVRIVICRIPILPVFSSKMANVLTDSSLS